MASIALPNGTSMPAVTGKIAFGEPQNGVPTVTARWTLAASAGSSR
jgi:hypothetical protein